MRQARPGNKRTNTDRLLRPQANLLNPILRKEDIDDDLSHIDSSNSWDSPGELALIDNFIYSSPFAGLVAQLVEQRIENPRVGGSIPPQATKEFQALSPGKRRG